MMAPSRQRLGWVTTFLRAAARVSGKLEKARLLCSQKLFVDFSLSLSLSLTDEKGAKLCVMAEGILTESTYDVIGDQEERVGLRT